MDKDLILISSKLSTNAPKSDFIQEDKGFKEHQLTNENTEDKANIKSYSIKMSNEEILDLMNKQFLVQERQNKAFEIQNKDFQRQIKELQMENKKLKSNIDFHDFMIKPIFIRELTEFTFKSLYDMFEYDFEDGDIACNKKAYNFLKNYFREINGGNYYSGFKNDFEDFLDSVQFKLTYLKHNIYYYHNRGPFK